MVVGLGTDLCEVDRIGAALARSPDRFAARVFTLRERELAAACPDPVRAFARFFAIKESAFKTLRRGWPYGIGFTEIELERPELFAGRVLLSGRAAELAAVQGVHRLMGASTVDEEIAAAVVIAERDAGAIAESDAGAIAERDAGAIAERDAGAIAERDAGITESGR